MMLRSLTVSLLFAVLAAPAYSQDSEATPPPQDNPETRQTDQSEDDYRRSQRRRGIDDIFEDIDINTRGSGSGTILGREVKAIDRLDSESRRHLNKQRAKALAEAQPGESIDAAYEPSETAKSDEYVARQEEKAWEEMMREANSGLNGIQGQGGGSGGDQGSGQGNGQGDQSGQAGNGQSGSGQAGQSGQGQSGQGQSGQGSPGQGQASNGQSSSPLRGGSASSAASILDQIKGRSGSANRAGQQTGSGGTPSGPAPQAGQNSQSGQNGSAGQASQNASTQSGPSQNDAQTSSDTNAADNAAAQAAAENTAQSPADAAAQSQAAQAAAEAKNDAAHAAAHRDTISPLERLKRDPMERDDVGGRTSASDYLKRKKN